MNMVTEVIILQVNHYDMGDNKGVSARILGNKENTNNKFGQSVSEASITDYAELNYLRSVSDQLPAKFTCELAFVTKKAANGKEVASVALSKLVLKNAVEFVDVKTTVAAK